MTPADPAYARRIAAIAQELGIPVDYGMSRKLSAQPEATDLVVIGPSPDGTEIRLAPRAAAAWRRMRTAAAADGIILLPLSGFRSVQRQTEIIRAKLTAGEIIAEILRSIAAPGYSEHHSGCALDVGAPDEPPFAEVFVETSAFAWMKVRVAEFGFQLSFPPDNPHGIVFEPWHWLFLDS